MIVTNYQTDHSLLRTDSSLQDCKWAEIRRPDTHHLVATVHGFLSSRSRVRVDQVDCDWNACSNACRDKAEIVSYQ